MNEDIVARLRQIPTAWPLVREAADEIEDLRFQLSGTQGELENALSRERTLLREQEDCRIGADNLQAEIERLLMNTGCARNQRSTQFCAEALDAQRDVERLRAERDEAMREAAQARQTIYRLQHELAGCSRAPADGKHTAAGETFIPEAL
jgi:chromosome segregation ATPase